MPDENLENTRIYRVMRMDSEVKELPLLVRASHPNIALRHVARKEYDVRVASQDDLVAAIEGGAKVEYAGEQPL